MIMEAVIINMSWHRKTIQVGHNGKSLHVDIIE